MGTARGQGKAQQTARPKGQGRAPAQRRGQQLLAFAAEADARRRTAKRAARKREAMRRELLGLGLARVPHRSRERFERTMPVHVTLRIDDAVPRLRNGRMFRWLEQAFYSCRERLGVRLTHFSVQDSHLHLIVEAENTAALSRGMQGMKIRIAKRLNALLGRVGQVFSDRFHAHVLRTPAEVRNAINYVLNNAQKHAREHGEWVPADSIDGYASGPGLVAISGEMRFLLPAPVTWLLSVGWKRTRARRGGP